MEVHAQLLEVEGRDVLNVGFGMGIVDGAIQRRNPRTHTIVEAHPQVLARMRAEGWYDKPGVRVIEWFALPSLLGLLLCLLAHLWRHSRWGVTP